MLNSRAELDDSLRHRLDRWFVRHALPLDIIMAVLACAFLGVGAVNDGAFGTHPGWTGPLEAVLWIVFFVEYSARLFAAPNRGAFVRTHIIELLALIATLNFLRMLRMLRVLRFLQFLRLAIVAQSMSRLFRAFDRIGVIASEPLMVVGLMGIAGTIAIGTLGLLTVEREMNPAMHDFSSAFWATLSLVASAGFSSAKAVTPIGKAITGAIVLGALVFVQFLITALIARFSRDDSSERFERLETANRDIQSSLARLEQLLATKGTLHVHE